MISIFKQRSSRLHILDCLLRIRFNLKDDMKWLSNSQLSDFHRDMLMTSWIRHELDVAAQLEMILKLVHRASKHFF